MTPERIWAWAELSKEAEELGIREGCWEDFDDPDTSRALGSVEYIRADLDVRFGLTLELAAKAAWDAIWPGGTPYDQTDEALTEAAVAADAAIRALAPEPAEVTAARVLLGHLENDAVTRAVSQEIWSQTCGEWQPSIPGAVEIIAAALRAIVGARHD